LPARAKNDFCCAHITFKQPGQCRPICTDIGGAPAKFSFECCAMMSANTRIKTDEPFSDSARCTSTPSCPRIFFSSITSDGKVRFTLMVRTERNRTEPPRPVHSPGVLPEPDRGSGSGFSKSSANVNPFEPVRTLSNRLILHQQAMRFGAIRSGNELRGCPSPMPPFYGAALCKGSARCGLGDDHHNARNP